MSFTQKEMRHNNRSEVGLTNLLMPLLFIHTPKHTIVGREILDSLIFHILIFCLDLTNLHKRLLKEI